MNYNININQKALTELSSNMDVSDASILGYISGMCASVNEKIKAHRFEDEKGDIWTWIDYQALMKGMPLLRIKSKGAITRRIQKIEENGFISTFKGNISGHTRLFVKLEEKIDKLTVEESTLTKKNVPESTLTKMNVHVDKNERGNEKHVDKNQPIINTSNTIHPNTTSLELFDQFWAEYPLKKAKKYAEGIWLRKIDPDIAPTIIEDVKKRKTLDQQWTRDGGMFIPHASTYLNQERWNDEITPNRAKTPNLPAGTTYTPGKYSPTNPFEITNSNDRN